MLSTVIILGSSRGVGTVWSGCPCTRRNESIFSVRRYASVGGEIIRIVIPLLRACTQVMRALPHVEQEAVNITHTLSFYKIFIVP